MNDEASTSTRQAVVEDSNKFFLALGQAIGEPLNSSLTTVKLTRPDKGSRSAGAHLLLCWIGSERVVALKRCYDNLEFIRREVAVADAKKILEMSGYGVVLVCGVHLGSTSPVENWDFTTGWEDKLTLLIDYGNYKNAKNLNELSIIDIHDIRSFCRGFGGWAAFNFLLGVRDRNSGNFVFFTDTQTLHSVDNEEGPFDSNGKEIGPMDVVDATRQHLERLVPPNLKLELFAEARSGFFGTWLLIAKKVGMLEMFEVRELDLTRAKLALDPDKIGRLFFP